MTGGFLLSPFLAGIVYAKAGYFPVFAMVLAVLIADLLLRTTMIEKRVAQQWDQLGMLSENGYTDAVEPSIASGQVNNTTVKPFPSNGLTQAPMPPDAGPEPQSSSSWFTNHFPSTATLLRSKRLMTAVLGIFVYMTICGSFDAVLAQFVKRTFDFGSSAVGLTFLVLTAPALLSTAYGTLSDRYGPRNVAFTGFATAALGLALSVVITHRSPAQIAGLCILLVVTGKFPTPLFHAADSHSLVRHHAKLTIPSQEPAST